MVLRMKNSNIFGVHWKIRLLGGVTKNQYRGGLPKKGETWTVCQFKGGLARKRGGECFWGVVDTPMHTMVFCVKLMLWSIVAQKYTNILIFYIFECGAECSAEFGAK